MSALRFADPAWLWALLLLPLLIYIHVLEQRRRMASVRFPELGALARMGGTRWARLRHALPGLRMAGLACLVVAMARPQSGEEIVDLSAEGHGQRLHAVADSKNRFGGSKHKIRDDRGFRLIGRIGSARKDEAFGLQRHPAALELFGYSRIAKTHIGCSKAAVITVAIIVPAGFF